jgi:hypothetical protein
VEVPVQQRAFMRHLSADGASKHYVDVFAGELAQIMTMAASQEFDEFLRKLAPDLVLPSRSGPTECARAVAA